MRYEVVIQELNAAFAANGAFNDDITATFSEAMTSGSLTTSTFTVDCGSGTVAGGVSYNSSTHVATLNPTANLPDSTQCTVALRARQKITCLS